MEKFFASILVVCSLFVMPIAQAEIKTYTGTDEYVVGENETHETAKKNSKIRAMRNAQDQAGVFIRSRSRMKDLELVEDEVVTIAEGILKVVGAPNHEIRLLGDGKGVLIVTTIQVEIDTDDIDRRLAEIARTHSTNKPPIDRPKPLETPAPEKISPPLEVDSIALSQQKKNEADKFYNEGNYSEAMILYSESIRLNPNYRAAYVNRGLAHYELKEYNKAVSDYTKAIQIDPNFAKAYNNRGNAYREMKQYEQAINDYNTAIELNLNYAHAYRNRGRTYQHLKNYRKAIEDLSKAINFDSKYTKAFVNRAECYQALGEHEKARADFAKARQLGWKG